MYPEIAANDAQREEWVRLFAIDEIEATDGDLVNAAIVGYSAPLTVEFLKQNPYLVLDTAFFSTEFKEQLVASIDNLDEKLDGLLIHSENFQAIRLLQQKYQNKVKCIYIDPPYNAKSSEILYKNTFKHSSWLSLIENRLSAASYLLKEDSVITIAIDEVEQTRLGELLRVIFPSKQITAITVVHNPSGQQGDNFSFTNEFAYFVYSDLKNVIGQEIRDESGIDVRTFRDNSGNNNLRTDAANCFYPIYVRNNEIIGFGDVSPDDYHPESRCIKIDENTIAVYPIDNNGVEKKWVFERGTVEGIRDQLWVKGDVQQGDIDIMRSKSVFRYKTTWTDKKYSANSYGSALLTAMNIPFDYPKSIYTVIDCVKAGLSDKDSGIVFDFFAGSGTTGHAIIRLNNEDKGARKYILAEMGNHFDTATKPRVIKAIYSDDYNGVAGWKKGKPISRRGNSHAFKYIRLESYEDTLNSIVLNGGNYDLLGAAREDYILSYMLNTESAGSASLLNVEKLDKPFSYKMLITRNLESKERNIDLVETFNYLIGLTVTKSHALVTYDADFTPGVYGAVTASLKSGNTYKFKTIEGTTPNGDKTLVIWREMTGDIEKDNAALDAYFLTIPNARSFKRIYVNCDNNLLNLRNNGENWQVVLIDEEMKKRMFEEIR
jgi:adenine-specific DNA-methyltransferase